MRDRTNLLSVRFIKANAPYLPGETAGFDRDYAFKLARGGIAVLVDPPQGYAETGIPLGSTMIEGFALDEFDLKASRDPKHVGGGVFEIAGVRVKGKAKAHAIVEALAALSGETPEPDSGDGD